jgi:outer membrane protein assembly factor BamB/orotate phosphoribosyltransferase
MRPDVIEAFAHIFWEKYRTATPLQIGAMETAGIPVMSALVATAANFDQLARGFFIRKSRKKDGLTKMIEGEFLPSVPVILVDDVMNTGKSLARQVEVIEFLGGKVIGVWAFVRFRDKAYYSYFADRGIEVDSLFTLDDFSETLGIHNLSEKENTMPRQMARPIWRFASKDPNLHHVVPKSNPAIDANTVYFGSDNGTLWALNQQNGDLVWSYKIGMRRPKKGILSSPALFDGCVYFGGFDGNVHAVDAKTGKKRWTYFDADWVDSSPAIAPDLGLLFVGLEFGLWKKRGGIVALDAVTGKKRWEYEMPSFTHSSPLYLESHRQVVIGSNDGAAYLFDARTGALQWKFETGHPTEGELESGYSNFDIKASFVYDPKRDLIMFGNFNKTVYFIDRKTGLKRGSFDAAFGFYSTPAIYADTVLASSLDKNLYCIDLDTYQEKWRWNAGARIFATPITVDDSVYIGANTGRFTELDAATGAERSFITLAERITGKPVYNPETKMFFVPTYANEIYCIPRS